MFMKKFCTLLMLSFAFVVKAQITITPNAQSSAYNFGDVQVSTYVDFTFNITTSSQTAINLSYVWGNAGISGVSSCGHITRYSVQYMSPSVSANAPGILTIRFYPRPYDTYIKIQGNCVKTSVNSGLGNIVGDLQVYTNSTYNQTVNLIGNSVLSTVGMEEEKEELFKVFPNPASGTVFFTELAQNVKVYDINGALAASFQATNFVDVSNLNSGMYFFEIQSEKGITHHVVNVQ